MLGADRLKFSINDLKSSLNLGMPLMLHTLEEALECQQSRLIEKLHGYLLISA